MEIENTRVFGKEITNRAANRNIHKRKFDDYNDDDCGPSKQMRRLNNYKFNSHSHSNSLSQSQSQSQNGSQSQSHSQSQQSQCQSHLSQLSNNNNNNLKNIMNNNNNKMNNNNINNSNSLNNDHSMKEESDSMTERDIDIENNKENMHHNINQRRHYNHNNNNRNHNHNHNHNNNAKISNRIYNDNQSNAINENNESKTDPNQNNNIQNNNKHANHNNNQNKNDRIGFEINRNKLCIWDFNEIDNELWPCDYVDSILTHLRYTELKQNKLIFDHKEDYMVDQCDITPKMRLILLDWLIEVHRKFGLLQPTLFLCINLLDRFLAVMNINRNKLQLAGCCAMWIASKYHEIYAPEINDFVYISDSAFTAEELIDFEQVMLTKLKFLLTVATPLSFAQRYLKIGIWEYQSNIYPNVVNAAMLENRYKHWQNMKRMQDSGDGNNNNGNGSNDIEMGNTGFAGFGGFGGNNNNNGNHNNGNGNFNFSFDSNGNGNSNNNGNGSGNNGGNPVSMKDIIVAKKAIKNDESRKCQRDGKIIENLVFYLIEHCLMDYQLSLLLPSKIASACLCYTLLGTKLQRWTKTMENETNYSLRELLPTLQAIDKILKNVKCRHKAVRKKYSSSSKNRVALLQFNDFNMDIIVQQVNSGLLKNN